MTSETPRIMFSTLSNPGRWEPLVKNEDTVFIACVSDGDAKKAEELFNSLSSQLAAKEAELSQERAKVARLREALDKILLADARNNPGENKCSCHQCTSIADARKVLASLPEQSARDANVLRAAEEFVATTEDEYKAMECYDNLCNAVRGDKKVNTSD